MTINPNPRNFIRRMLPKKQMRQPKLPARFTAAAIAVMAARSGGICEIDSCGRAVEYHHRGATSMGGSRLGWVNQPANGLAVTGWCHLKAEGRLTGWSRRTSRDNGWLVSRNGTKTADKVPVLYRGRWVLLTDDGAVTPVEAGAP